MQFEPPFAVHEGRVVPGADRVEPELDRTLEEGGELDLLVAAQAGVRVRPALYSEMKSSMTSSRKRSEKSQT